MLYIQTVCILTCYISESSLAKRGIYRMAVSYNFEGDCFSAETVPNIKIQFIKTLNSSLFEDACSLYTDECSIKNVQVIIK